MNMRRTLLSLRSKRVKGEKLNQSISASFLSTTATPTSYPIHQRYETSIFELHNQPPQKIRSIIDELEKFTPTKTKKYGRSSELNVLLKQMVAEKAQSNVTKKGSKSAEGLRSEALHVRWLLQNQIIDINFNMDQVNAIITAHAHAHNVSEAYQWYLLARDVLHLQPSKYTYNVLLPALSTSKQWDLFYYVYQDMQQYKYPVDNGLLYHLLHVNTYEWSNNWRWIRQVLFDQATELKFPFLRMKAHEKLEITPLDHRPIQISTFQKALDTLMKLPQLHAVKELYMQIAHQYPIEHNLATNEGHFIYHPKTMILLASTAFSLQDSSFLMTIISNFIRSRGRADTAWLDDMSTKEITKFFDGLEHHILQFKIVEDDVIVLMSYLLQGNETDRVNTLWKLVYSHYQSAAFGSTPFDERGVLPWHHFLRSLFRLSSTQHPKQYEHLQAQSTFLRTIFPLPDPTNQATPHEQPLSSIDSTPTTLPRLSEELIHHVLAFQDGKVVHDFIEMYYALQDSHSVTSLALYCLQKDVKMSEETMQLVLETIQRSGDHKLVVELFDMYSAKYALGMYAKSPVKKVAVSAPSSSATTSATTTDSTETLDTTTSTTAVISTEPPAMIFTPPFPVQECPHIYHLILHSLAKIGEIDLMLHFFRVELPRQRYKLSHILYNTAIYGLSEQGEYKKALQLFQQAKTDFEERKQNIYQDYKLIMTVLSTCAKGRLPFDALEIFAELQESQLTGSMKLSSTQFATLSGLVIVALTTPETISNIMKFLHSTETFPRSFLVTKKMLLIAFASGILLENQVLVEEIYQFHKAKHGGSGLRVTFAEVDELANTVFQTRLTEAHKVFLEKVMEDEDED